MKLGGNELTALRLGGGEVVAAYLGSTLVWTAGVRLAGALLSTTAWSGDVAVARPLAGALDGASSIAGVAEVARAFSGALADTSSVSGDLSVFEQVVFNSALAALSEISGGVSVSRVLAGLVGSLSAAYGEASIKRVLAAAEAAISALSGTVGVRRALAGAMGSVSSASAALTVTASGITFSFVGYCQSTNNALNFASLSAGAIAAGDLLVFIDYAYGGSMSAVTPTGFANHISTAFGSGPYGKGMVSTKKATGSEGSVTGMNADVDNKLGLVFRPSAAFTTITAAGIASEITAGNPTSKTCDPSAETVATILLTIAAQNGATAALSTRTPAADATILTSNSDLLAAYNLFNSSPASVSYDMNDLGDMNWRAGLYLKVAA